MLLLKSQCDNSSVLFSAWLGFLAASSSSGTPADDFAKACAQLQVRLSSLFSSSLRSCVADPALVHRSFGCISQHFSSPSHSPTHKRSFLYCRLQLSALPPSLPCREREHAKIKCARALRAFHIRWRKNAMRLCWWLLCCVVILIVMSVFLFPGGSKQALLVHACFVQTGSSLRTAFAKAASKAHCVRTLA